MKIERNCETPLRKKFGIYKLVNSKNNKVYIGSTGMSFSLRWNQHSHYLYKGCHGNKHLQRAFNKYNCEWRFEIIEILEDKELLFDREKYWIEYYISNKIPLFNQRSAENGRFLHDEETIKKISSSKKGQRAGIRPVNYEQLRRNWLKPIIEYENGNFICEWESCKQAAEYYGLDHRYIHNFVKGKSKTCTKLPGKMWKYKD